MMSTFSVKLVLAVLAVNLFVGVFPGASSSVLPHDGEKSLSNVDCGDGLRKTIGRKEGRFGCQSDIANKITVPFRSLRVNTPSPPPSPTKNLRKSQNGHAAPPQNA